MPPSRRRCWPPRSRRLAETGVLHRPRDRGTGRPARGEQVAISWLAERLRDFVDEHPEAEATIDSLASWLARLDEDDDDLFAGDASVASPADAGGESTAPRRLTSPSEPPGRGGCLD